MVLEFFYKETLPLKIRKDLTFNECLIIEVLIGKGKSSTRYAIEVPHEYNECLVNEVLIDKR